MARRILIFSPAYPPLKTYGGPSKSVRLINRLLGQSYHVDVVTGSKEVAGEISPDIKTFSISNEHSETGHIRYLKPTEYSVWSIRSQIVLTKPDIIYLNTFFHPTFSFRVLVAIQLIRRRKFSVLIAPRGQLSAGRLKLKKWKKYFGIRLHHLLSLGLDVSWHATSSSEVEEIKSTRVIEPRVFLAGNLIEQSSTLVSRISQNFPIRLIFASRVSREKGLRELLLALSETDRFDLTIFGSITDQAYFEECRAIIAELNTESEIVRFLGWLPSEEIEEQMADFDVFVSPSVSENFGHSIVESLRSGVPVLVGPDSPWGDLESFGAGWLLTDTSVKGISDGLDKIARSFTGGEIAQVRDRVGDYFESRVKKLSDETATVEMFRCLIRNGNEE